MGWISKLLGSSTTDRGQVSSNADASSRTVINQEDDAPPFRMNPGHVSVSFVSWPISKSIPKADPKALVDGAISSSQEVFWSKVIAERRRVKSYFLQSATPGDPNDVMAALSTLEGPKNWTVVLIPMKIPSMGLNVYGGFCVNDSENRLLLPYDGGVLPL